MKKGRFKSNFETAFNIKVVHHHNAYYDDLRLFNEYPRIILLSFYHHQWQKPLHHNLVR